MPLVKATEPPKIDPNAPKPSDDMPDEMFEYQGPPMPEPSFLGAFLYLIASTWLPEIIGWTIAILLFPIWFPAWLYYKAQMCFLQWRKGKSQ